MDAVLRVVPLKIVSVLCEPPPNICPNGKPPATPKNECCPVCTAKPQSCAFVKCKPQPTLCADGKPPFTPPNGCCPVCIPAPNCSTSKCGIRGTYCQNGKLPVQNGCCRQFPRIDCTNVRCKAPTQYCEENQDPRPDGVCCAICKLNCSAVSCPACSAEKVAVSTQDDCCPKCLNIS